MTRLRIVHTGALSAALNMAVDDVLLDAARAGGGPILRTYTWEPPAVSIGFAQRLDEAIDVGRCRDFGIDVVRRPTGGRAVLHCDELTYSFHCADGEGPAAYPVQEAARQLGECLAAGLRRFGVDARVSRGASPAPGRRGACFASTSRWELTCDGRKLAGSAQRRSRGALLQHGSILAGPGHLRLVELLPPDAAADPVPLAAASTDLRACLGGGDVDLEALRGHLARAFAEGLGLAAHAAPLTAAERQAAEAIGVAVYGSRAHLERLRGRLAAAGPA